MEWLIQKFCISEEGKGVSPLPILAPSPPWGPRANKAGTLGLGSFRAKSSVLGKGNSSPETLLSSPPMRMCHPAWPSQPHPRGPAPGRPPGSAWLPVCTARAPQPWAPAGRNALQVPGQAPPGGGGNPAAQLVGILEGTGWVEAKALMSQQAGESGSTVPSPEGLHWRLPGGGRIQFRGGASPRFTGATEGPP